MPRRTPLFESLLVFENYPADVTFVAQGAWLGLRVRDVARLERANYPLTLVAVLGERLRLRVSYDHDRFDRQLRTTS